MSLMAVVIAVVDERRFSVLDVEGPLRRLTFNRISAIFKRSIEVDRTKRRSAIG